MALTPTPRGKMARLYVAPQTDFATFPTGAFQELNFMSETVARANTLPNDPEMGGARHNPGDPTDPGPGRPTASGQLTLPMDMNQLTWWLYLAFGAPASSTDDGNGNYTHVFHSGAQALPDFGAQIALRSGHVKPVPGLKINELSFATGKEEGYRTFTASVLGRDASNVAALTGASQTALPARAKTAAVIGRALIDDVAIAQHISGSFSYANALEAVDYADDSASVSRYDPGDRTISFQPRLRTLEGANPDAVLGKFQDERTPFKFEVEWKRSETSSLSLTVPRAFAPTPTPTASNGGALEFDAQISAAQSLGETPQPMLIVTLKNQIALTAVTGA